MFYFHVLDDDTYVQCDTDISSSNYIAMTEDDYNAVMTQFQTEQNQQQLQAQMNALLPSVINEILTQLQANNTIAINSTNMKQSISEDTTAAQDPIAQWQDLYSQLNSS
jgi:hypothetical protein